MADDARSLIDPDAEPRLSPESKVGLFVLAGLAVLMISILMLGDIHFRPQNTVHLLFRNVEGITDKSPVKISGVDVGSVRSVSLMDNQARLTVSLRKDVRLYRNARARIRSTGIIGTKFIAIEPGSPVPGTPEEAQIVASGDTLLGEESLSIDELMERVAKSLDDITGGGALGENLNATMANLRSITNSLNAALGRQQQSLVNIVKNVEDFTVHAKSVAADLDEVLKASKEEIKLAIKNLKETLDKSNALLGGVQRGEGVMGALFADPKTSGELKETVTNLRQASDSAKEVLGRFTKVRAFWVVQTRYDFPAGAWRGDVGLRLEPRPDKFYEVIGQNLGPDTGVRKEEEDYERENTITALIGRHWGPWTGAVGFIRSRGGVEARWRPFQNRESLASRLELQAQASDFGRDDTLKGRRFDQPIFNTMANIKVNKWVSAGIGAEDVAETAHLTGLIKVAFEDKDLAYLLGFAGLAR